MDTYALHLAVAALAGASVAAVSSCYAHCKTLAEILDFALAAEIKRGGTHHRRRPRRPRRKRPSLDRRSDVEAADWVDEEMGEQRGGGAHLSRWIQALPEGTYESAEKVYSDFSPH